MELPAAENESTLDENVHDCLSAQQLPHNGPPFLHHALPPACESPYAGLQLMRTTSGTLEPLREQDRLLPKATVARMMQAHLGKNRIKISKSAKLLMLEVVSEFICFITSEASDINLGHGRSISSDDIVRACDALGLEFLRPLSDPVNQIANRYLSTNATQGGSTVASTPFDDLTLQDLDHLGNIFDELSNSPLHEGGPSPSQMNEAFPIAREPAYRPPEARLDAYASPSMTTAATMPSVLQTPEARSVASHSQASAYWSMR